MGKVDIGPALIFSGKNSHTCRVSLGTQEGVQPRGVYVCMCTHSRTCIYGSER